MKALVLAAGRGKRMRPLTDSLPKPLLQAGSRRLIDYSIDGLVIAGITEIVINVAHLSHTFEPLLGRRYRGATIEYSIEGADYEHSLETLGGIAKALPLLTDGTEPFIVTAGDIASDFDFKSLISQADVLKRGQVDAHLILVPNPDFHPQGDMGLVDGRVTRQTRDYTFSSIGLYAPRLFKDVPVVFAKLFPWLDSAIEKGRVTGEVFRGQWDNVGTPEALAELTLREEKSSR